MCPDSPENKCPTVECPDCGGQGSDEGGFRGGKKWKAICPRCGGSGRINTSGPDDSKIENKYQGSPSVPDREGECPDCEGESIEGRGCRTCNSTGRVVSPSQTEGGGPDDTKQVSKEQGASPSVPPAVTTSQGPVTNTGEDEDLIFIRRELPRVSLELKETRAELDAAQEGKAELPPFVKSVPLPDDHSGTSEPWALRILAEEIWFQERGDWPDEQDAEMFNDPDWVKRFLTARTVARCWDSARAALDKKGQDDG